MEDVVRYRALVLDQDCFEAVKHVVLAADQLSLSERVGAAIRRICNRMNKTQDLDWSSPSAEADYLQWLVEHGYERDLTDPRDAYITELIAERDSARAEARKLQYRMINQWKEQL